MIGSRPFVRGLALVAIATGPTAAIAANNTFDPRVELSYGYTDNLVLGGTDPTTGEIDDTLLALDLWLDGESRWQTGSFKYLYRPTLLRYDEVEDLDRDEHRVQLNLNLTPNRKVDMVFRFDGTLTQVQGDAGSLEDEDLFLGRRTDRELLRGQYRLRHQLGPRWSWGFTLDARSDQYDVIPAFESDPTADVEDRETFTGKLDFNRKISETGEIGLRYSHERFELEVSGDSDADSLIFTYAKRVSRKLDLEVGVGGFLTESSDGTGLVDETGVQALFDLGRRFQSSRLSLNLRHEPTGGGSLSGTSINSVIALTFASIGSPAWGWRISPRYAIRDSTVSGVEDRNSLGVRAELNRRISKKLRLQLRTNYIDQSSDDPGFQDRSVFHVDGGIVWSPWGGTALAER